MEIGRWHEFYLLTGTGAATMMSLMFGAISFAIGSKAERSSKDVHAWVTPSLVYVVEVFVLSAIAASGLSRSRWCCSSSSPSATPGTW